MSEILYGTPVADTLRIELRSRIAALREQGIEPCLAIVRVGEDPGSLSYERSALRSCEKADIRSRSFVLPADSSSEAVIALLETISSDPLIHGCLLLRPLPRQIEEHRVCAALRPEKDVDGATDSSLRRVFVGRGPGFCPCTPEAVLALLDYYGIPLTGKRVTIVGRSLVVGRPLALLMTGRDATVTLCHRKSPDLPARCREADILVVAAGSAGMITADYVREGQIVVDVGTTMTAEGKLRGDVDFPAVEPLAAALSPVPRGVGAITTAILMKHVVTAAETMT